MDLPTGSIKGHEFWRAHIQAAQKFNGSHREYCKLHGLNHGTFGAYRNKLGFTSRRKRSKASAFSQIQVMSRESASARISLPDPKWLADFLKAWVG